MEYGLGVDLGTTYTAAAVRHNGHAEIARLGSRRAEIPSLVFVRPDGRVLIGEAAERRGAEEPARLAREFKRRVGDPVPLLVGGSPYPAHALMARLLEEVLTTVTRQQEGPPTAITVTHPANWGPYKRELLGQAVRLAELDNVTLRAEPEAAAVRYATSERVRPGEIVAVYDLGGGTFDAAVLRKTESGFELLGEPEGIEQLGGIDFDEAVLNHVTATLGQHVSALDPDNTGVFEALARLRRDCIEAKEALSYDTEVMVPVALPSLHTRVRLNRSEFETMITPALLETIAALRRALRSAGVEAAQLRSILLAGGSSRIPLVSQLLSVEFGRPVVLDPSPEHSIALGAALVTGRDLVTGAGSGVVVDPVAPAAHPAGPDADDGTGATDSRRRSRMSILLSKLSGRSRPEDEAKAAGTPVSGAPAGVAAPDAGAAVAQPAIAQPAVAQPAVAPADPYVPDTPSRGVARVPVQPVPPLVERAKAAGRAAVPTADPSSATGRGPVGGGSTQAPFAEPTSGAPAGGSQGWLGSVPGVGSMPAGFTSTPPSAGSLPSGFTSTPSSAGSLPSGFSSTPSSAGSLPSGFSSTPPRAGPLPSGFTSTPPSAGSLPAGFASSPPGIASVPSAGGLGAGSAASFARGGTPISSPPASFVPGGALPGGSGALPGRLGTLPGRLGTLPGGSGTLPGGSGPLPGEPNRRRLYLVAGIIAVVIALAAAAGLVYILTRDEGPGGRPTQGRTSGPIGQWVRKADLPVFIEGAAMAAWKGQLWVAGGQRDNDKQPKSSEVFVYDPPTNAWTPGPPLPQPISHAALVPTPTGLFFIAGTIADGGSTQVLRLNDAGTGWEAQPPLPETRVAGVGGFTGKELIYAGGTRKGAQPEPADTVWALRGGAWVEIGKLQIPRQKLMAAGNGVDTLWLLGGRNINTNEKYSAIDVVNADGVAKSDRELDWPIDSAAAIYLEGSGVCIVGGQTPGGGFSDWWCEERGLDRRLPPLDPLRGSLSAAMIGRTVYVVGGYGKGFLGIARLEAFTFPPL